MLSIKELGTEYKMKQDLLHFTDNQEFIKIMHDKGISFGLTKTLFLFFVLIMPFGYLTTKCSKLVNHSSASNSAFILLFFIVISIYSLRRYGIPLLKKRRSKFWIKTTAKIIEIGIFMIKGPGGPGSPTIHYIPAMDYTFIVNGKEYRSKEFSFYADYTSNMPLDPLSSNQYNKNNEKFSEWMEKKEIKIYYNPENPNEAVVFKDFSGFQNILYTIMALLSLMSFVISTISLICWIYFTT